MQAGAEPGGRVLVVAESGHEPLVRALAAEGHDVDTRLPASALGPAPDVVVVVRASSGAAVLAALERRYAAAGRAGDRPQRRGAAEASAPALLRAGAHTCLPDPVHPDELLAAVAGALAIQRSRNASAAEPEGLSDPLTGLGNRRLGERELDLFVARSTRHGHALARGRGPRSTASASSPRRTAPGGRRRAARRRRAPRAHAAQRRRDRPLGRAGVPDDPPGHRPRRHPPRRRAPAPLDLRGPVHGRRRRPSSSPSRWAGRTGAARTRASSSCASSARCARRARPAGTWCGPGGVRPSPSAAAPPAASSRAPRRPARRPPSPSRRPARCPARPPPASRSP